MPLSFDPTGLANPSISLLPTHTSLSPQAVGHGRGPGDSAIFRFARLRLHGSDDAAAVGSTLFQIWAA